ncbi:MAG: caspase family protein [Deltaproteobacteria bacterium]|nr:caspase family protein [Deltaproteobacteria bacterium]
MSTLLSGLVSGLVSGSAGAEVERFAIFAGNNDGGSDEAALRHAEDDARRLSEVLTELGSFRPENVTLLFGRTAVEFRRALIAVNERIRTRLPMVEPVLVVYYSGHADARALHLGDSELELAELESLVRGSPAAFRVLVVDACRSGSLTRVKRGKPVAPFKVELDEKLEGEGVVFLTASSANEDAQESDELSGSFFTHHLITGILGAADENRDGRVGLREAYAYAYDGTLRSSSRSLEGLQHPTFRFDLKGRADFVLTEVTPTGARGTLELPSGAAYLVFRQGLDGPVIAETGPLDRARRISLPAGRYGIRSPRRDRVLEGTTDVKAMGEVRVDDSTLDEIAYARLARKGGREVAHGFELGLRVESPLFETSRACLGPAVGYSVDLSAFGLATTLGLRASYCRDGFANEVLTSTIDVFTLGIGVGAVLDARWVSLSLGLNPELSIRRQDFETPGQASGRVAVTPALGAELGAEVPLGGGFAVRARGALVTHSIEEQGESATAHRLRLTFRATSLIAKVF